MNKENVIKAIEAMPVCSDGKKAITKLVEEITGEKLTPKEKKTYRRGQRFIIDGSEWILASPNNGEMALIGLSSGNRYMNQIEVVSFNNVADEEMSRMTGGTPYVLKEGQE